MASFTIMFKVKNIKKEEGSEFRCCFACAVKKVIEEEGNDVDLDIESYDGDYSMGSPQKCNICGRYTDIISI